MEGVAPLVEAVARTGQCPVEAVRGLYEGVGEDDQAFLRRVIDTGLLECADAYAALAESLDLSFEDPAPFDLDPELLALLSMEEMAALRAVPVRWEHGMLVVALADPTDLNAIDALQNRLQAPLLPAVCMPEAVQGALDERRRAGEGLEALLGKLDLSNVEQSAFASPDKLREIAGDDAIVQLVDFVLEQALRRKASDIHVEPGRQFMRVRLRVDGELDTLHSLPRSIHAPVLTRIKLVSGMDIAERRKPQDGRFELASGGRRSVEFRVSTLPSLHGEKCVLRVLDKSQAKLEITDLGFSEQSEDIVRRAAATPNGMVLVTGPTGSGKTTTLYGVLSHLNRPERNLVTTEDPVEYELAGITQVPIDVRAGRTFAGALRAILRQDPDVVMVGEIRDRETAEIAVHAALTGHLLLSTLHTNSALGTVGRIVDMGIEPYLLAPTLRAIVAQRLVRRICDACAQPADAPRAVLEKLGLAGMAESARFVQPVGCPSCRHRGFSGRVALHEVLEWSPELEEALTSGASESELREVALTQGFRSLAHDGIEKAMAGLTSVSEVLAAARV